MKILAIDTSAELCAACVFDVSADRILAQSTQNIGRGHAEILMDLIADVLEEADTAYKDLGKIAVTCGPGSFTGVRVGIASARGLAFGLGIPAVGVGTLEGLEQVARENGVSGPLATLVDGRRDEAYYRFSEFEQCGQGVSGYKQLSALLEGIPATLCGSGAEIMNRHLPKSMPVSHSLGSVPIETVARIGAGKQADDAPPEPVYLRAPDAKPQTGFALPRV